MTLQRVLILPDTHAPYHDKKAWALVMRVAKSFQWHTVLLLGDFFDFYAVSDYDRDPERAFQLEDELAEARPLIKELTALPAKRRIITLGNHEERLERYLKQRAPHLWKTVLKKDELGLVEGDWEVIPYKKDTTIGRLYATHDVGRQGALQVLNMYQDNVVSGHDHQMTYVVRGNAKGVAHVSATFGWLGDIEQIDYAHRLKMSRDWVLGFGVGYLNPTNRFIYLQPVPLVEYTCVVEGRYFA